MWKLEWIEDDMMWKLFTPTGALVRVFPTEEGASEFMFILETNMGQALDWLWN